MKDVRQKVDKRRRDKLERMVRVMARAQASTTNLIQGIGLKGGLGYVVVGELKTLSDLSGTTMKDPSVEGEEEGQEGEEDKG